MKTSIKRLTEFHEDTKVFSRLVPPPIFIQVREDNRTSLADGDIHFTLWFGPIPIRWHARHEPGPTPTSFADRMISGPTAYWYHEHIFEEIDDGAALIDRVTLAHKPGWRGILTRLLFDGIPLRLLFFYRHLRTRIAVER